MSNSEKEQVIDQLEMNDKKNQYHTNDVRISCDSSSLDTKKNHTQEEDVNNKEDEKTITIVEQTKPMMDRSHWWQFWRTDLKQMAMKPVDFPRRTKRLILMTIALATLIAPISTTIYMPALVTIQNAFGTDDTTMNATLSAFTFTIAVCPIFWSALGDVIGRRRVYLISFCISIIGSIGCTLSINIGMFLAFRIVSALGSSSVLSMGAGTIADTFEPSERGMAFAMYATGPLLGPALGPIIGGYLNIGLGWRSTLAFVAIYGVVIWICILCFLPETYRSPPVLPGQPPVKRTMKNPLSALIYFKYINISLAILYSGLSFLFYYLVNTTYTRTLALQYKLDTGTIGLCYLPIAFGAIIGNQFGGRFSDYIYKRRVAAVEENGQTYPEMRISGIVIILSVCLACCGYISYGWCVQKNVHYAYILVSVFFLAIGLMAPTVILNVYMTDSMKSRSAAVMACSSLVRFTFAGIGALVASDLEHALSNGILFSVCGGIVLGISLMIFYIKAHPQKWLEQRVKNGLT